VGWSRWKKVFSPRPMVQGLFVLITVGIGVQFALFVRHFETAGLSPPYLRPAGVEAFLPVGALVSLKNWFHTGEIDPVHPAALVLLLTFLGISLLARRAFCSWICPIGTLSEILGNVGQKIMGRNFRIWTPLDVLLRFIKYAVLLFFVKAILIDMPLMAVRGLLASPYWAISDVRMLHFFTGMSHKGAAILLALAALSVIYRHFWCRYLCPYGALTGLIALFSPLKVRREADSCSGCGKCRRQCPSRLPVDARRAISSPECIGCLTCVDNCPRPGTLRLGIPLRSEAVGSRSFAVLVLALIALGVGAGMLTGNWETNLTYHDYLRLIPAAQSGSLNMF
jgi:ferredoxin